MGCDGCPLYPPPGKVQAAVCDTLVEAGVKPRIAKPIVKGAADGLRSSALFHLRGQIADQILTELVATGTVLQPGMKEKIAKAISAQIRCYAATLTMRWGENPRNPGKKLHKGYPRRFEEVTFFPGVMEKAARWPDLAGTTEPETPWLDGCRRLLFVSDMGDALSESVDFNYLEREIVRNVTSPNGRRHIWLWLTKRPKRMARFHDYLKRRGTRWPKNLVPMTSVLDQEMAVHVKHLKHIPAAVRGLSVEPLWEDVEIDLTGIDWVIVGGESGAYARPFDLAWARKLRDQCKAEGKAFFLKQLGAKPIEDGEPLKLIDRHGGDWEEWPEDLRIREVPEFFRAPGLATVG